MGGLETCWVYALTDFRLERKNFVTSFWQFVYQLYLYMSYIYVFMYIYDHVFGKKGQE